MLSRYTRRELAHLVGVPTKTIARWERGERVPNVYHAIGLAVALHRLVDELFAGQRMEWIKIINRRAGGGPKNRGANGNVNDNENAKRKR